MKFNRFAQGLLIFLFVLFGISACKDNPSGSPSGILKTQLDTLSTADYYFPQTDIEIGYEFIPATDGIITHLGTKTGSAGQFMVRIFSNGWGSQAFNANVIAQKAIEITAGNTLVYERIDQLQVKKDTKYVITVSLPQRTRFKRMNLTFPYKTKNVSITQLAGATHSDTPVYFIGADAIGNPTPYIDGIPDFVFVSK